MMNTYLRKDIALYQKFESGLEKSLPDILDDLSTENWNRFMNDLVEARFLVFSGCASDILAMIRVRESDMRIIPLYTSLDELLLTQPPPPDMRIAVMNFGSVCRMLVLHDSISGIVVNPAGKRNFPIPSDKAIEILRFVSGQKLSQMMWRMGITQREESDKPTGKYH